MSRSSLFLNLTGLTLGTVGGFMLFFALPLKSSDYRLVETKKDTVEICLHDKEIVAGYGGGLVTGGPCPEGIAPSIAAVSGSERPMFVPLGLGFIVAGFLLQIIALLMDFRRSS